MRTNDLAQTRERRTDPAADARHGAHDDVAYELQDDLACCLRPEHELPRPIWRQDILNADLYGGSTDSANEPEDSHRFVRATVVTQFGYLVHYHIEQILSLELHIQQFLFLNQRLCEPRIPLPVNFRVNGQFCLRFGDVCDDNFGESSEAIRAGEVPGVVRSATI